MTYRATLHGLPPSTDPSQLAKPQVIHSNSRADIDNWANGYKGSDGHWVPGVMHGKPNAWVVIERQRWEVVETIRHPVLQAGE